MRDLYQRKKGGVWWCEFYGADSRRVRCSTKCKDRRAAGFVRQRLEREANDPSCPAANAPACSVEKVLEHFANEGRPAVAAATLSMYMQKSGHLKRVLGDRDAGELQDIDVMKGYIRQRTEEGAASGTLHKEIVTMRQALYAALEAKLIRFDPRICFPRFRSKYVPRERWLSPDEFTRLLLAFKESPHRQLWLVVAVYTGARDSEVDSLCWEHIDWRQRVIQIHGTKTDGSVREIPLQPVLASVLARSKQDKGYIVGEWGNVRRDLHAACEKHRAGMPPCSPNDLRRTFATWLANQGVPENVVAKMLGHGSSRMVRKVYSKLERSLMRREMAKLSGACATGVPDSGPIASSESLVSQESLGKLAEILTSPVLGPGIEPGTRGFSVRAPINRYAKMDKKKGACTTGAPRASVA